MRWSCVLGVLAALAIIIDCIAVFGYASKEFGIGFLALPLAFFAGLSYNYLENNPSPTPHSPHEVVDESTR